MVVESYTRIDYRNTLCVFSAHVSNCFNNLWYTYAQAHKFNNALSPTCRVKRSRTLSHAQHEPDTRRIPPQVSAHFRSLSHLLNALELGIEVAFSNTEESHRGENWRGNPEGTEIEQQMATFLDDDTVNEQVKNRSLPRYYLGGKTLSKETFRTVDNKK